MRCLVPIDDIPECGYVVRSAILIIQVVGVFPNIETDDGGSRDVGDAFHERGILIWGGGYGEGAVGLLDEPSPARTESS